MSYRETEYNALRAEVLHSDRTCLLVMGFLISITGAAGTLYIEKGMDFAGFIISPVWIIGFWYFSEKRFGIKTIGKYIEYKIEFEHTDDYGWQLHREELRSHNLLRTGVPFGPYQLESVCTVVITIAIPIVGIIFRHWLIDSFYFILSMVFCLAGLTIVINANIKYRKLKSHNKLPQPTANASAE